MRKIKLNVGSPLSKEELKAVYGGVIHSRSCTCTLYRIVNGHFTVVPLTDEESEQFAQITTTSSCIADCKALCGAYKNSLGAKKCDYFNAIYHAEGSIS